MSISLTILASGSSGNAMVIHHNNGALLIDNGLSKKMLKDRLDMMEIPPEKITGVFLTHDHVDHYSGVRLACDLCRAKLYISAPTYSVMRMQNRDLPADAEIIRFTSGVPFQHEGMVIEPFSVPHDASDPVALVVRYGEIKLGVATDLGKLSTLAINRLSDCNGLVLESNYDLDMLRNSKRPLHLIRRIMSPASGHLCNMDAVGALERLLTRRTTHLTLAHLSKDCNRAEIVANLFQERLENLQRRDILLSIAQQFAPISTQTYPDTP